jgi:hypothetical protein
MGRSGAPSGNDPLLQWRDVEDCPAIGQDLDDVVADGDLASHLALDAMSAVSSLTVAFISGHLNDSRSAWSRTRRDIHADEHQSGVLVGTRIDLR